MSEVSLQSIKAFNPLCFELLLLAEISDEISNFKQTRKGRLNHTYVATPYLSSCFAVDIFDGKACLGVPSFLFDMFRKVRWYVAHAIKGTPGIFLVFDMGKKPMNHPVALRIFIRKSRVNALLKFDKLRITRMADDGSVVIDSLNDFFELDIKEVKALEWELF